MRETRLWGADLSPNLFLRDGRSSNSGLTEMRTERQAGVLCIVGKGRSEVYRFSTALAHFRPNMIRIGILYNFPYYPHVTFCTTVGFCRVGGRGGGCVGGRGRQFLLPAMEPRTRAHTVGSLGYHQWSNPTVHKIAAEIKWTEILIRCQIS